MTTLAPPPNYTDANRSRRKRVAGSLAVSVGLHVIVLIVLAFMMINRHQAPTRNSIDTAWADPDIAPDVKVDWPDTPVQIADPTMMSPDAGGTSLGIEFDPSQIASVGDGLSTDVSSPLDPGTGNRPFSTAQRTRGSAANEKKGSTKQGKGRGQGEGDGVGNGRGPGFFGSIPLGKKVVFVVDNSRSMNAKHDSPAKTRFRRLKEELIKVILELPKESEFFVVFFADETLTMPARSLQQATPEIKDHYLRWVAQVDTGGGPTDPREAMKIGLSLQPDVIYFLTDGEFKKGYSLTLRSIKQTKTAIYTFAFGETLAEETLRDIAEKNRGEYKFVP